MCPLAKRSIVFANLLLSYSGPPTGVALVISKDGVTDFPKWEPQSDILDFCRKKTKDEFSLWPKSRAS